MHTVVVIVAQYFVIIPVIVWLVLLWRLRSDRRWLFVLFSTASVVVTVVLVKIATTLHQDPRPFIRDGVHPYFSSATDNGFPSDHTVFSSLLAFVVMRMNKWAGLGLLVVAILIGTARVIGGVHHGQDIVAGAVIAALSVIIVRAGEIVFKKVRRSNSTPKPRAS